VIVSVARTSKNTLVLSSIRDTSLLTFQLPSGDAGTVWWRPGASQRRRT
jgi:hypothetical protein